VLSKTDRGEEIREEEIDEEKGSEELCKYLIKGKVFLSLYI
jgi:hypothetical protein